MGQLKIEKNIPMPPIRSKKHFDQYAVLARMEIGDSVLFESKKELDNCVNYAKRNYSFKGSQRQIAESQWRWWRTA